MVVKDTSHIAGNSYIQEVKPLVKKKKKGAGGSKFSIEP